MITRVDIALLPEDLQEVVLAKYRVALMDPSRKLTMEEAAWLYGYTYQTIRCLVAQGRVRSTGTRVNRRVSHAAVRQYRTRRVKMVRTKKEREQQQRLG